MKITNTESLSNKIKKRLFFAIYCLIANNICNTPAYMIIVFLEFFQIAPIVLANGLWTIDILNLDENINYGQFLKFSMTITGTLFDVQANLDIMSIFSLAAFGIVILVFIILFIICEVIINKGKVDVTTGFRGMYFKFAGIFILCINALIAPLLYCFCADIPHCVNINGTLVFNAQKEIVCFTPYHMTMLIILPIIFLFFITAINLCDMIYTDSAPHSKIPWASPSTIRLSLWKQLFKLSFFIILLYDPEGILWFIEYLAWAILQGIILYFILVNPPFINTIVETFNIIVQGTMFAFILIMFAIRATNVEPEILVIIALFGCCIIIGILILYIKDLINHYYLNKDLMEVKDESTISYLIYLYFNLIDKSSQGDRDSISKVVGIYSHHQLLCSIQRCYCKEHFLNESIKKKEKERLLNIRQSKKIEEIEEDEIQFNESTCKGNIIDNLKIVMNWIQSALYHQISLHPRSFTLRLMNAFYSKEYSQNMPKSIYDLLFAQEILKSNLKDDFIIYRFKKNCEKDHEMNLNKHVSLLDISKMIEFHILHQKCLKKMSKSTEGIMEFWQLISSTNLEFSKIFSLCSSIANKQVMIDKLFGRSFELFPRNFKILIEKRDYERFVINNDPQANILDSKINLIKSEVQEQIKLLDYNDPLEPNSINNTAMAIVSANPQKIGRIININREFELQIYVRSKDIIGQNVSILLLDLIAYKHNQYIEEYIKDGGKSINIERTNRIIVDGKNYLTIINITIVLKSEFFEGLNFICLFTKIRNARKTFPLCKYQPKEKNWGFLLCNADGVIIGISELLSQKLLIPSYIFSKQCSEKLNHNIKDLLFYIDDPINDQELGNTGIETELNNSSIIDNLSSEEMDKQNVEDLKLRVKEFKIFIIRNLNKHKLTNSYELIFWVLFDNYSENEDTILINEKPLANDKLLDKGSENLIKNIDDLQSVSQSVSSGSSLSTKDLFQKRLLQFKENTDTKSSNKMLNKIKNMIDILFVVIIIFAIASIILYVFSLDSFETYFQGVQYINLRINFLAKSYLSINLLYAINQTESSNPIINDIPYFDYLNLIGQYSNSYLLALQKYINQMKAQEIAYIFEYEANNISIYDIDFNNLPRQSHQTINLLVFRLITLSNDILFRDFTEFKIFNSDFIRKINTFKYNWLHSLYNISIQNELSYSSCINNHLWVSVFPYLILSCIISLLIIICFFILRSKIPNLQRSANEVLLIYSNLTHNEVRNLTEKGDKFLHIHCRIGMDFNVLIENNKDKKSDPISIEEDKSIPLKLNEGNIVQKEEEKKNNIDENLEAKKELEEEDNSHEEDENNQKQIENNKSERFLIETLEKKKQQIKQNIQTGNIKLTFFIIVLILYCTSLFWVMSGIGINYVSSASSNINLMRHHFSREANLIFALIYGSEVQFNFSQDNFRLLSTSLDALLLDNSFMSNIESGNQYDSPMNKKKLLDMDSFNFCPSLNDNLSYINFSNSSLLFNIQTSLNNQCTNFSNQILQKGLGGARSLIYSNLKSILINNKIPYFWNSKELLNSTGLYMFYIRVVEESFQIYFASQIYSYLAFLKSSIAYVSIGYFAGFIIVYFLLRLGIFSSNEKELFVARGMLRLAPSDYMLAISKKKEYSSLLKLLNF